MTKFIIHSFLISLLFFSTINVVKAEDSLLLFRKDIEPTVAIYLSGGGARGLTQVGILSEFEKSKIHIDYIAGTSIGAIIGGLCASGYSASDIEKIVSETNWEALSIILPEYERNNLTIDQKYIKDRSFFSFRFNNFRIIPHEGISFGKEYYNTLQQYYYYAPFKSDANFDNLNIPLRVAATDISSGKTTYFSKGNLINIIRASGTFPLRYTPVKMDSSIYIDGGLFANIPAKATFSKKPDLRIGIDNTSPLYSYEDINSTLNIADQILSIAMKHFENQMYDSLDIVLKPELNDWYNTNFTHIDSLILLGKQAFDLKKDSIISQLNRIRQEKITAQLAKIAPDISNKQIAQISQRINTFFRDEAIKSVSIKKDDVNNDEFDITPIRYNIISDIQLLDSFDIPQKDLTILRTMFVGKVLNKSNYKEFSRELLNIFIKKGYSFVSIDSFTFNKGKLSINVNSGLINSIEIKGNQQVSQYLIKRELTIKIGKIAKAEDFITTWNNLYNCGLFKDIVLNYKYNTYGSLDITIELKPRGNQEINIGSSLDHERGFRAGLQLNQFNLFNTGTSFNTGFFAGTYDQTVEISLNNSRLGSLDLGLSISTYFQNKDYPSYIKNSSQFFDTKQRMSNREQRYGFNAMLNSSILNSGKISVGIRQEYQRTYSLDSNYNQDNRRPKFKNINILKARAVFDTENRLSFSSQGYKINLLFETNLFNTANHIPYSKIYASAKYNFSIGDMIFTPKGEIGAGDATMPIEEMFSLGGIESFYGLQDYRLRGRQVLHASLEMTYKLPIKLFFNTYFSARYDFGNTWKYPDKIDFDVMLNGIGTALTFDTPIGPAKFALGKSFTSQDTDGYIEASPFIFYFYIGMKL